MKQTEAVTVVTYLNRAGLLHAMEGQGAVWADALEFVRFEDARDVARDLARTRRGADRWVTPGDIIDGASRLRASRVNGRTPPPPPPCIPHDNVAAQIGWQRTVTRHLADGLDDGAATAAALTEMGLPPLEIEHTRPVAALVEQVARKRGEGWPSRGANPNAEPPADPWATDGGATW